MIALYAMKFKNDQLFFYQLFFFLSTSPFKKGVVLPSIDEMDASFLHIRHMVLRSFRFHGRVPWRAEEANLLQGVG